MDREDTPALTFPGNGLVLRPVGRAHPGAIDYWDGNWLLTEISVRVGAFRGTIRADLRTEELASFRSQLSAVYASLSGEARLVSMEEWIDLRVTGDGLGHFDVEATVRDQAGGGNALQFGLELDQTHIPEMLASLDRIALAFPVLGEASPGAGLPK